jgi:hypothetical protein
MDQKEVRRILTKYYDGLTSGDEESALARYFAGDNVPEEFNADKEWFRYCGNIKVPEPGNDFFTRLNAVTDAETSLPVKNRKRGLVYYRIAATVALLVTGYLFAHSFSSEPAYMKDTYNDPKLAMAEVQRVLTEVSLNMKKGTEGLPELKKLGEAPAALSTFRNASRTAVKSIEDLKSQMKSPKTEKEK